MLCGTIPFASKSMKELGQIVIAGKLIFPDLQGNQASDASPDKPNGSTQCSKISKDAQALISWMLNVDPMKRPTIKQVLQHRWILSFKHENFGGRTKVYTRAERAHMKYMI
jgi:serine/threonine protein kinase